MLGVSRNLLQITHALVSFTPKIIEASNYSIIRYRMDKDKLDKELASSLDCPEFISNTWICDAESIQERGGTFHLF